MKWTIPSSDIHLTPHASILYEVLKNTEDIELKIALDNISLEHRLKNDLGMDSIQIVSVLYELEVNYPALNEEMVITWLTIRDVLNSMSVGK